MAAVLDAPLIRYTVRTAGFRTLERAIAARLEQRIRAPLPLEVRAHLDVVLCKAER